MVEWEQAMEQFKVGNKKGRPPKEPRWELMKPTIIFWYVPCMNFGGLQQMC